ncbi:MAG: hypothetical protein ACR2OX_04760 [Methyloligellaceae bacterium]
MPEYVVIIGVLCLVSAATGAIVAKIKRRSADVWAFACFIFPPILLILLLLPKNTEVQQKKMFTKKDLEDVKEHLFD